MYNWKDDLKFALTLHQLKNHGYHILGALAIAGTFRFLVGPIAWFGIPAVLIVGSLKELIEAWKRTVQNKPIHVFDSIFDLTGWVLGSIIPYLL